MTDSKNSIPSSAGVLGVFGVCGEVLFGSVGTALGILTEAIAALAFFAALGMAGERVGGDGEKREMGGRVKGARRDLTRYIDVLDTGALRDEEPTGGSDDPVICSMTSRTLPARLR